MSQVTAQIKIPDKLVPVFTKENLRYRCSYGGRGSGKSRTFALMTAIRGYAKPIRILCARELQTSIKDSVHNEISAAIEMYPWLADHYEIGESYIRGKNGTEYLFKGLRHNYREIKSTADIDICWIEEAEAVSEKSWQVLIPTIRNDGSEIWATWNPEIKDSATDKRFRQNPPDNSMIVQMNYSDNPWFPKELEAERIHDLKINPQTYSHVWEGDYLEMTDAQVFKDKWRVKEFTPDKSFGDPLHGIDFGFSQDPTTAIKTYIKDNKLYIYQEAYKVGLELDDTADFIKRHIPEIEKYTIRADSARPESISYLKRHGLPYITSVKKWQGSVEDGIAHIKSYEDIIIHPQCEETIKEFTKYSYKVDQRTGDILPKIEDNHNHIIDGLRYSLVPLIKGKHNRTVIAPAGDSKQSAYR